MDRNFIQRLLIGVFLVACLALGIQQFTFSDFGKMEARNEKLDVCLLYTSPSPRDA